MDKFVIIFIDDILIYSKNEEEHVEHLAEVLNLLREHQLYAKHNKCSFFQTKVHYLGHVVSKECIIVDPKKRRVIMEWETPRNVDDVRSFMGLTGLGVSSSTSHGSHILLHPCKGKERNLNGQKNVY